MSSNSASGWRVKLGAALAIIAGVWTGTAIAADGVFDEVKVGVLAHDVAFGGHHKENGYDINGELLFVSPDFLQWAFAPRPHVGLSINTDGNTDQVYGGLTWTVYGRKGIFANDGNTFVNFAFGGAVHDGWLQTYDGPRKELGSRILFRESLEVGYWILSNTNVSVYLDHISNAGLADQNDGLTNIGMRVGFGL
jgi:lipid A 3-O-deacylase